MTEKLTKADGLPARDATTRLRTRTVLKLLLATLTTVLPIYAIAGNAFYLVGYGIESELMGGADAAVSRDAFAANNNPSGLTQISGQMAEFDVAGYLHLEASHTDAFNNYRKPITNGIGGFGNGAYARHIEGTPFSAGAALVVQGGIGWVYSGLNTAFGTRDDASALFAIIKLAPAVAWEINDKLSVGLGLGVNYLSATQELFPNTSNPAFAGFRFKGASGVGLSSKLGLQYRPANDVTIGVTYGTQTSIPLKDGTLRVNFSDPAFGSMGVVRYDNAKLTGMRLPEELAIGIAFRPTDRLLVSLEDKWFNWSDAIGTIYLSATNPRTPGAPSVIALPPAVAKFNDQHVIKVGAAYLWDKDNTLYFGINHGSRPQPDQYVNPIFAPIQARHYTFGAKHQIDNEWETAGGVEVLALQSVTYDNPLFGPRANERHFGLIFFASIGRHW